MAMFRRGDSSTSAEERLLTQRGGDSLLPFHRQLVGKRLYLHAQVRFMVAVGIVAGTLGAHFVAGVEGLDVRALVQLAAALAVFDAGVFAVARRYRELERRQPLNRALTVLTHATISIDFVFLTLGIWLVGGAKSPFQAFYLLHVILAGILLSPRAAGFHALFGYLLLSGLALGEWRGMIPVHYPVGAINSAMPLDGRYVATILVVQALLMALILYLVTGLTGLLRRNEEKLRGTNDELERVSRLQRDFLHIALHDLKAPVASATMLVQTLKIGSQPPLNEQQEHWVERIRLRLNEALAFLHDLDTLASLDSLRLEERGTETDIQALLGKSIEENEDWASAREQTLTLEIPPDIPPVFGIERLLHEAVVNLLTNAIKYTPQGGAIRLRAAARDNTLRIEVEDNGIGIAPADQQRLFHEFVRIRREDERIGKVAGSGLGLSIVQRIAELHGGEVSVESELNQGSVFCIALPIRQAPDPEREEVS